MNSAGRTTETQRTDWEREPNGKVDRSTVSRIFSARATFLVSAAAICVIALISLVEWIAA